MLSREVVAIRDSDHSGMVCEKQIAGDRKDTRRWLFIDFSQANHSKLLIILNLEFSDFWKKYQDKLYRCFF